MKDLLVSGTINRNGLHLVSSCTVKCFRCNTQDRCNRTILRHIILFQKEHILIKAFMGCTKQWQHFWTGNTMAEAPGSIYSLTESLSVQSFFELEHCLLPSLFPMISQQSAIIQGPGLLLDWNSTHDISLLQRSQSLSRMSLVQTGQK